MRYSTPELVEVGAALTTVLGGGEHQADDSPFLPPDLTPQGDFELN